MGKISAWFLVVRLSTRWINSLNIGDEVEFHGKRYFLNQGVNNPIWSLVRDGEHIEVHRQYFKKVMTIKHAWRSFRSGYRFYMGYWFRQWATGGIKPWMLGANIWKSKPPKVSD